MLSVDPLKREAYNTLSSFDVKSLFLFNFKSIFEVNHKLKNQTKPPCITLIKGFKKSQITWLKPVSVQLF